MKNALLSLSLAATIALAGCAGFAGFFQSQNPGGGSGGGGGSSTTSGLFYVLNGTTNEIVGFQVVSDALKTVTNATINLPGLTCLAITHNNNYLYVGTTAGIYYYSISSAGALTLINNGQPIGYIAQSMQVDSTNGWLVIAQSDSTQIVAVPLNTTGTSIGAPSTGTIETSTLSAASTKQLVISPDNNHLFVALGTFGTDEIAFTAININPFGTDTKNPVYNSTNSGAALSVAVDPKSEFLYVGETEANPKTTDNNSGGVRVFAISSSTNTLTEQTSKGSPYASGGIAPAAIVAEHSGSYVYVANETVYGQSSNNTGNVTGFLTTISTTAGVTTDSLGAITNSPFAAGTNTIALVEDNSYSFLIALNLNGSPDTVIYTFNSTNAGALDLTINTTTGNTSAPDPTGAFAVAAAH